MQTISWKCLAVIAIAMCSLVMAVPVPEENDFDALSPEDAVPDNELDVQDRDKRKIFGPDIGFGVKNAVLGYVFGKIDGILDAKTKLLNQFDETNVAKNKAAGIEPPAPISSLQQLLQAVIQPKLAVITSKFGALSGSSAGGLGSLSGGSSGGLSGGAPVPSPDSDDSHADLNDDDTGAPVVSGGSGNILSSFLKLSGPILSSSSSSAKGGQLVPIPTDDDEEDESDVDNGVPLVRVTRATPVLPQGVTDDTPDFNREMVMLDIPDQLFGNSFTIVTNISKLFGDLMMSSARRYANFVQYFKPLLGKALTVKGLYPPPPTTTPQPITDTNDI
ncbi:uncharacterized protein LOC116342210 [Contarinia nasturtii]|uniref:uncharacterized protein LOC116342210 n=1 Tax=Contarinia nasturtii TaxID=265458 RepID=UPI0012D44370|nr:uncharacterized protein LOC116342210 [Contarinia nasturtii]